MLINRNLKYKICYSAFPMIYNKIWYKSWDCRLFFDFKPCMYMVRYIPEWRILITGKCTLVIKESIRFLFEVCRSFKLFISIKSSLVFEFIAMFILRLISTENTATNSIVRRRERCLMSLVIEATNYVSAFQNIYIPLLIRNKKLLSCVALKKVFASTTKFKIFPTCIRWNQMSVFQSDQNNVTITHMKLNTVVTQKWWNWENTIWKLKN